MTTATKADIRPVAVGDIFESSWGYDQTNVDWYAVTEVSASGKTATFMQVTGATVEDHGPGGSRVTADATAAICRHCSRAIRPIVRVDGASGWRHVGTRQARCFVDRIGEDLHGRPASTAEPVLLKRRLRYGGYKDVSAKAHASYASMYRWDGKPTYATSYGFGH